MGVGWWVLILIGLAFLVVVLRGTLVEANGRRKLVGFDLDRLGFCGSLVGFDDLVADWGVMIWLGGDDGGDGSRGSVRVRGVVRE